MMQQQRPGGGDSQQGYGGNAYMSAQQQYPHHFGQAGMMPGPGQIQQFNSSYPGPVQQQERGDGGTFFPPVPGALEYPRQQFAGSPAEYGSNGQQVATARTGRRVRERFNRERQVEERQKVLQFLASPYCRLFTRLADVETPKITVWFLLPSFLVSSLCPCYFLFSVLACEHL